MAVGFGIEGEAAKRGLLGRLPTPDRVVTDIERWLAEEERATLRHTRRSAPTPAGIVLRVSLHPAAEDVEMGVGEAGQVEVRAPTSAVGPGYHTHVAQLIRRLGGDLGIAWRWTEGEPPADEPPAGEPETFLGTGDRDRVERAMMGWLRNELIAVYRARARGNAAIPLALPPMTRYTVEGALLTPLGARDDQWLETAINDSRTAIDVWSWWADATDARYSLGRALSLMWTEVRWRPPHTADEAVTIDEALRHLDRAHALSPTLPYPWREWAELLEHRGARDPLAERIAERAAAAVDRPPIGYRRSPVVAVHGGWAVPVPGSFAETRTAEEWRGSEAGRSITISTLVGEPDRATMPPDALLNLVAGHLGEDVLHHRRGPVVGRARLGVDAGSGIEVGVLEGYSAVRGGGVGIRIVFEHPDDWEWAVETWRSVEPA